MITYPKIETLYVRDPKTFKVMPDKLRLPEFGLVKRWLVTEKVDGTNVRVSPMLDGAVDIRGRTDKAQFNPVVLGTLRGMFPFEKFDAAFERSEHGVLPPIILFGEAYGEKINKGGKYRDGHSFRLFDVMVDGWWLNWSDVRDVAGKLDILTVPLLSLWCDCPPIDAESLSGYFEGIYGSQVAYEDNGTKDVPPEGIVARTDPLLFRRGDLLSPRGWGRVMWKLKFKDFG